MGFFMVKNHGISGILMEEVMKKCDEFHNLPEEEKKKFADKGRPLTPIRHGTSFHPHAEKFLLERLFQSHHTPSIQFPSQTPRFQQENQRCDKDFASGNIRV